MILATRGIAQQRDIWKKFMETRMWNWVRYPLIKDKKGDYIEDGVDENGNKKYKVGPAKVEGVQGHLRPIELWEYVFPEPCYPQVLAMLTLQNYKPRPEIKPLAWMVRKALKLDKLPEMPEEFKKADKFKITQQYIPMQGMAVYPLGIKRDIIKDWPNYGWRQEGI